MAGETKTGTKASAKGKGASAKAPIKSAVKKSAAKDVSQKTPAKSPAPAKTTKSGKPRAKSSGDDYTQPELREKIKQQVIAGDKGGRAGQWSARKAQLLAHEYEAQGGGYKHPRNAAQKSLKDWGEEKWHTADGEQAVQGKETHRYLPDAAWKKLSPEERKATDQEKVKGSKDGKQFVANTPVAAKARKQATKKKS